MFTTPCFIRKNTPEIRERLFELGYDSEAEDSRGSVDSDLDGDYLSVWTFYDMLIKDRELVEEPTDAFYTPIYERDIDDTTGIDCGTNEDLFFALAALRDDTDRDQYFVTEELQQWVNQGTYIPIGSFELCLVDKRPENSPKAHKASVKELIKYFKNGTNRNK